MRTRLTNALLGLIGLLLFANLIVVSGWLPAASGEASNTTHDVLRARLIELVAADGKVVAQLHTAEDGAANLRMRDGNGEVRVKLGATSDGSALLLLNQHTEPVVNLVAAGEETTFRLSKPGAPDYVVRP